MNKIMIYSLVIILIIPLFFMNFNHHPVRSSEDSYKNRFVPNQLIIALKNETRSKDIDMINRYTGCEVIKKGQYSTFQLLTIPNGKTVDEMINYYQTVKGIEYVFPNYRINSCMIPDDEYYNRQWHLQNSFQGGINVEPAWNISTGEGVVVAVIDSGILQGSDLLETCILPGYDFVNDDNDATDDNGHGTHVAGTIAQSTNNTVGACGVAFDACLLPVKVLDSGGSGSFFDLIEGIYFSIDQDVDIISLSLGSNSDNAGLEEAIKDAYNSGITIIAAAGNCDDDVIYPAAFDEYVIAVGATRFDKTKAPYSNYGLSLDLVAPGGDLSKDQNNDGYPDGVFQQTFNDSGWGFHYFEGTSMATPHVTGVAALVHALNISDPDVVRFILQSSAIDLGDSGWDEYFGYGLVNAFNAVSFVLNNQDPMAGFSYSSLGLNVSFLDDSIDDNLVSWSWDFGDGTHSSEQNPIHRYDSFGSYDVMLTVTDALGKCNSTFREVTIVNDIPSVDFLFSPESAFTFEMIFFSDESIDSDGSIVNWSWSFGDGNRSFLQHPTHTFSDNGNYTVNLTITDNDNATNTTEQYIQIMNREPLAYYSITPDQPTTAQLIQFTDTSTDVDGSIVNWTWDFGDGTISHQQHPTHQYTDNGEYQISLSIRDDDGESNMTIGTLNISNQPPVCQFSLTPSKPSTVSIINFTDNSFDADGVIVNWTWDFGDGNTSYLKNPVHSYDENGEYLVSLLVKDDDGECHSSSSVISIDNIKPQCCFSFPLDILTADPVDFTDTSIDSDGSIVNWSWSFGDGNRSFLQHPTHTFSDSGNYTVNLTITDNDNATNTTEQYIQIMNREPQAHYTITPDQPTTAQLIQFTDTSTDVDGSIVNWTWDFGDGTISHQQHPTHQYTDNGEYQISLSIRDDDGESNMTTSLLFVENEPPFVSFSIENEEQINTKPIRFFDNSLDVDGVIVNWTWDFGDGNHSFLQHPSHQYDCEGDYTVNLTVFDDEGKSNSTTIQLVINQGFEVFVSESGFIRIDDLLEVTDVIIELTVTHPINVSIQPYELDDQRLDNSLNMTVVKWFLIDVENESRIQWPIDISLFFTDEELQFFNVSKGQLIGLYTINDTSFELNESIETLFSFSNTSNEYNAICSGNSFSDGMFGLVADQIPPTKVCDVIASDKKDGKIEVSWLPATDNFLVSRYQLYRDNPDNLIAILPGNTTNFLDGGLALNKEYSYWVNAVDSSNNSGVLSNVSIGISTRSSSGSSGSPAHKPGSNSLVSPLIDNADPVAVMNVSKNVVFIKESIIFNASLSFDADGSIVNYSWHFGDDTVSFGPEVFHLFKDSGEYNVTLIVTDDTGRIGSCSSRVMVLKPNRPPNTPFFCFDAYEINDVNTSYELEIRADDLDDDSLVIHVDWGDGSVNSSGIIRNNSTFSFNHMWSEPGVYVISAYAEDSHQMVSGSSTVSVYVNCSVQSLNGLDGVLLDYGSDGEFDWFYDENQEMKTMVERYETGSYLIDCDDDGVLDTIISENFSVDVFKVESGLITSQTEYEGSGFSWVGIVISIGLVLSLIGFLVLTLFYKKR